uniref:Titin n=1 Tax=Hucho hucho TaxID=62062 RepID=A0A4W5MP93_9TELE
MDFIVKNLNENEQYIFRVMAVNHSGRSGPCESKPVTIKETITMPEFDLRGICQKIVIARAGDEIKVEIPVMGRPKPTVSWTKDGQHLKITPRIITERTATTSILNITECIRSDTGHYGMTGKNIVGSVTDTIIVKVHDVPGPPKGPIKIDEISRTYGVISWGTPENDGGVPINNYIVELRETTGTSWVELTSSVIRTIFKATRLKTGAEYQFRVKAKNRYGAGQPIISESVVAAYPFKPPGPPSTPKVVAFTKDTMTIGWNEPVSDGGSEVIGYHIERKERSSILWQKISKSMVRDNQFKSSGLEDGVAYEFRITAENMAGIGKPSKASEAMLALDPVDPPGQPEPIFVSKNIVTIQWTKPEYDGGFKITGYVVEKRDLPAGRWMRANFTNIIETTFTVSGLTQNEAYEFRVLAKNAAGSVSEPSEPSDPITCTDDIVEPRIMVDAKFKDVILLKAGENFKLDADVAGQPLPSMVWTKGGKDIENTMKLTIKMTDLTTTLINKDSLRRDGGEFVLTATNVGGFAKHIFNVKVLDRPGPPGGPLVVSDITSDNCILEWAPPADDGGAEIDHYVIEKRESSRLAWTNSASGLTDTQFKVNKLLKGNEYIFRVMAVNKYGVGEPLESVPTIANNPWVPADPPKDPEVTIITKDSMILMWKAPEYDGGTPITNYNIERKDKIGLRWVKCNKKKVKDLQFKVTGLLVTHEYEFRILAENAAGLSLPSNSSPFYKATDTLYEPGPPGNPRVVDTTKSSITIAWNKPNYDGGSEITGYIVETCVPGEEEWTIVTPPGGLMGTSFTLMNLEEDKECMIQVSAVNSEGIGEEATIPGTPRAQDRLLPPEFDLDAELKKVVNIRACNTLRLFVPIRGRPSPEAKWTKEDGEPISRATIESTTSYTSLVVENVNRFDSGKYVLTIENMKINVVVLDKPGAPQGPISDSMVITWEAPGYDGGSNIIGYIIEKHDKEGVRWTRCNRKTVTDLTYKVTGLMESHIYEFRVLAENVSGVGEPSSPTVFYKALDPIFRPGEKIEEPDLDIDPDLRKVVNIKAGCSLRLFIPIRGRPQPEVKWGKDEGPIKENAQVEVTSSYTSLVIDNVNRFDSGKYTVSAENASGEKSALISVRV